MVSRIEAAKGRREAPQKKKPPLEAGASEGPFRTRLLEVLAGEGEGERADHGRAAILRGRSTGYSCAGNVVALRLAHVGTMIAQVKGGELVAV